MNLNSRFCSSEPEHNRQYVKLEVAAPAKLILGENQPVLDLVEGEMVQLECEGRRAFPKPVFQWSVPGRANFLSKEVI